MSKRDFVTLLDITGEELTHLLARSQQMKNEPDPAHCPLIGKSVGLIFEKASTRTRVSFEAGIYQLGGQSLFMSPRDVQISRGEPLNDTARVLSRYLSALVVRTYAQETVEVLAEYASIPVINALTDLTHPCQILADLLTMMENSDGLAGSRLTYLGDGNNVANSLIVGCAMTGMHLTLACPEGYDPDERFLSGGSEMAQSTGGSIRVVRDPAEACADANFLYTDVWASMGQEEEKSERDRIFAPYQLNINRLKEAAADAGVLHCLPAYRGKEITDEVMESPGSLIFDQAENRLHTQKALLEWLLASE
jgi:ornithine carbamoyltransferase